MAGSVVVVGGGVFGLTAALALRRRGHAVTVHDRYGVPSSQGASVDSSRLVRADYGDDGFFMDLARDAIKGWHAWNLDVASSSTTAPAPAPASAPVPASTAAPLYHEVGVVFFRDGSIADGGYEHDSLRQLAARGLPVRRLRNPPGLAIPAWAAGDLGAFSDGYIQPHAGWADARGTVAYLAGKARDAGVVLLPNVEFGRLETGGNLGKRVGRWAKACTAHGFLPPKHVRACVCV